MNKWDSGAGGFGLIFPGMNWWKDANWIVAQFEGIGGGSSGEGMSGSGTKHDKFPDYMDTEDEPCNKAKADALVVTDQIAMNIFLKNYPPYQTNPNMSPNFSGAAWDTFEQMNFDGYSDETILSEILDKHNSGIVLTKMDSNGNFKKINVNQTNNNGTISYTQSNCP